MHEAQPVHSFSDAALTNSEADRFRRAPFAKAIAETLSLLRDKTSIAVGIYGPWGDGKTTVLSFIEEALRRDGNIITMYFNPWRFGDEDELLRSFFESLVGQLNQSLSSAKEFFNKWKDALPAVPYVGNAAEKIVGRLTAQRLDEFKVKTEKILEAAGRRIVVLMDDIDRLETSEIQTVFRLVKLTASFNYVAYVLAFDDKVVSAALQEKYGSVSQSGQGFLEKIIQVPLHLPKIPTAVLLDFCRECVADALSAAGQELDAEQKRRFRDNLALVATQIGTPRQCKRYANGAAFALGILRREVNVVDLLLIEALRVFHPRLYEIIRSHRDWFVSGQETGSSVDPQQFETEVMRTAWEEMTTQDREMLRKVLMELFPDFQKSALQRQKIGLYDGLADRQRVASQHYFDRFFTYSVPIDEIADSDVASLFDKISERPIKQIASQIKSMIDRAGPKGSDAFIFRIGLRRELLNSTVSPNLARGIAAVSENFSYEYETSGIFMHFSDAVHLVRQLILNTRSTLGEHVAVLSDIVRNGVSLPFAYSCLEAAADTRPPDQASWWEIYGGGARSGSTKPPITNDERRDLADIISRRIRSYFDNPGSYEIASWKQSKFLVEAWLRCAPKDAVRQYLEKGVTANRSRAVGVINWYLRDSVDRGILVRERYADITNLVSEAILVKALEEEYGDKLRGQEPSEHGVRLAKAFLGLCTNYRQIAQSGI